MRWNSDGVSTQSHLQRSQNASPYSPVNEGKAGSPAVVRFKIFNSRPCVENHHTFTGRDFPRQTKQSQSFETSSAFGTDKETFICSDLTRNADHFFVIDSNRAAIGLTNDFQHQEIADRFWNAQT